MSPLHNQQHGPMGRGGNPSSVFTNQKEDNKIWGPLTSVTVVGGFLTFFN
jgi:hypothetical protein